MDVYGYLNQNYVLNSDERYKESKISDENKKLLCDVGIPERPLEFIQFNIRDIKDICLMNQYIIIGNDYDTYICIDDKNKILSIDKNNKYPIRFINSSLLSLLIFIIIYSSYEEKLRISGEDDVNDIVNEIKTKFNEIDKMALANEENWWSIILEQIELGLM